MKKIAHKARPVASSRFIDNEEALNGRITSICWDMIPGSIALLMDIPETEAPDSPHFRACLVFEDVLDYTFPLVGIRSIVGIFIDFYESQEIRDGYTTYSFYISLGTGLARVGKLLVPDDSPPIIDLSIDAKNVRCFVSSESIIPASSLVPASGSWLSFQELQRLAPDAAFVAAYEQDREQ